MLPKINKILFYPLGEESILLFIYLILFSIVIYIVQFFVVFFFGAKFFVFIIQFIDRPRSSEWMID